MRTDTIWTVTETGETEFGEPFVRAECECEWACCVVRLYVEPDSYADPHDDDCDTGYWKYEALRDGRRFQGGHGYGAHSVKDAQRCVEEALR